MESSPVKDRRSTNCATQPTMTIQRAAIRSNYYVPSSRVNCRQHLYAVRVIDVWNSLSEDVVSAKELSLFVSRLKCVEASKLLHLESVNNTHS